MRLQTAPADLLDRILTALPAGRRLSEAVWNRRHRAMVVLVWLHLPGLIAFALLAGRGLLHSLVGVLPIGVCAILAGLSDRGRRFRAVATSLGLLIGSATLIHFGGGYIEMHFHFFVVVGLVALYQDWIPFLVTVGGVVLHHGLIASLNPQAVYNHPDAWDHPWRWALIHGTFVVAATAASLASWRLNEYHALHDPLTQLPNRTLFLDRLTLTARRSARRRRRIAILYLDVDDLKPINDRLGHPAGDQVLITVAERLCACARSGDMVARLGGDEFGLLLGDVADEREAVAVAARILATLRTPVSLGSQEMVVTASIGIAAATASRNAPDDLLRQADAAMYAAKRRGKGRSAVHDRVYPPIPPAGLPQPSPVPAAQMQAPLVDAS